MNKTSTLTATISRFAMAAALVAVAAVSAPSLGGDGSTAGLNREDSLRVARPLKNAGDPSIRDMPVLAGHGYQG